MYVYANAKQNISQVMQVTLLKNIFSGTITKKKKKQESQVHI